MLMIRNGKIMLTRGDSAYITVTLKAQDGAAYTMQAGDKLTLTVRKQAVDTSSVLLQSVSDSNTIKLAPEQTEKLASGSYSYDIQLTTVAGDVFTVAGLQQVSTAICLTLLCCRRSRYEQNHWRVECCWDLRQYEHSEYDRYNRKRHCKV